MSSRVFVKLHASAAPPPFRATFKLPKWGKAPERVAATTSQLTREFSSTTKFRRTFVPRLSCLNTAAMSTGTAAPFSDLREARAVDLSDFALDGAKVTSVAQGMWRRVVRPGDTVIDATCGNGHDALELARMVCTDDAQGYVYAFDVQEDALANSAYLLDRHLNPIQRKQVKLLQLCHSQIEKIVSDTPIRLVTFNLGYLPGGDKNLITNVDTTMQALQAASNVLEPGGLISVVAYIGHPGGREEFDAVMSFAATLAPAAWVCSQHEWINRSLGPRLIFMLKR